MTPDFPSTIAVRFDKFGQRLRFLFEEKCSHFSRGIRMTVDSRLGR